MDLTNKTVRKGGLTEGLERMVNRAKSRVRSRVEHVFAVVKRLWGFGKVRYRGLARTPRGRSWPPRWPTSSWRAGACWHECVCMARRVRPMRGERADSRQLASQDSRESAIGLRASVRRLNQRCP